MTMGNRGSIFSKTDDGGDQSVSKWGWTSYYKAVSLKRKLFIPKDFTIMEKALVGVESAY